jgi:outer membrane protein assembly factor BamA
MLCMRSRLAQIVVLGTACLLTGRRPLQAQEASVARSPEMQGDGVCPPSLHSLDERSSGPEIAIAQVNFLGSFQMPVSDQDEIATSIEQHTRGTSLNEVTDEALERARAGWQDRGYFKALITGDVTILTSTPGSQSIALGVHVDEGLQYSLGGITFKDNKAITNVDALRSLFPNKDGDIFSREKLAKGLENLRKAYGNLGYINFTSIPNTVLDDDKRLIFFNMDLDEGRQFRLTQIHILGVDEVAQQEILKDAPIGQIYNARLFELFLDKHASVFKFLHDDPAYIARRLNERVGTVEITLDAGHCPVD